jgi:hypothetical protein
VEEMQSDWGQQGRRYGFRTAEDEKLAAEISPKISKIEGEINDIAANLNSVQDLATEKIANDLGYRVDGHGNILNPDGSAFLPAHRLRAYMRKSSDGKISIDNYGEYKIPDFSEFRKNLNAYEDKLDVSSDLHRQMQAATEKMPPAPFIKNSEKFSEAGIKKLINQAAREGKSSVVFSSGKVQFSRWGEEGLIDFYDKIIPKVGKKIAKRLDPDAFAGTKHVYDKSGDVSGNRFVIEITPKMREEALKGQPLFTVPAVPTGLLGEEKMTGDEMLRAGII